MNNKPIKGFYPDYLDIKNVNISASTVHIELKSNIIISQWTCCRKFSTTSTTQYTRTIQVLPISDKNTIRLIQFKKI